LTPGPGFRAQFKVKINIKSRTENRKYVFRGNFICSLINYATSQTLKPRRVPRTASASLITQSYSDGCQQKKWAIKKAVAVVGQDHFSYRFCNLYLRLDSDLSSFLVTQDRSKQPGQQQALEIDFKVYLNKQCFFVSLCVAQCCGTRLELILAVCYMMLRDTEQHNTVHANRLRVAKNFSNTFFGVTF
jgi:hypothetical protein